MNTQTGLALLTALLAAGFLIAPAKAQAKRAALNRAGLLWLLACALASVPMARKLHSYLGSLDCTLCGFGLGALLLRWSQPADEPPASARWRGAALGTLVALGTYLAEWQWPVRRAGPNVWHGAGGIMTASFLFACPLAVGAVCVLGGTERQRASLRYALLAPVAAGAFSVTVLWAFAFEGAICIAMAWPALAVLGALGGLIAYFALGRGLKSRKGPGLACALVPLALGPFEAALAPPAPEIRRVENDVVVQAPADRVWEQVRSVPAIQENEQRLTFAHFIGFPRPIAATLTGEGVGAYRTATFEGGVVFKETIDSWRPDREISFSIHAQPVPPGTLDEHVTIGGPYFDVLEGRYRLVPLDPDRTLVRLDSRHRLSTRFDFYAGRWTDFIMSDIQGDILRIIKARCER